MARQLMKGGYRCVVHDVSGEAVQALVQEGAGGSTSLAAFVERLATPRTVWRMVLVAR